MVIILKKSSSDFHMFSKFALQNYKESPDEFDVYVFSRLSDALSFRFRLKCLSS